MDATTANPTSPSVAEFSQWSQTQKLAALLLMMERETAAHIMKSLEEVELESVATEMARFSTISRELQALILHDFTPVLMETIASILGGVEPAQTLLEKSVGMLRASDIICRISPRPAPVAAMQGIVDMDAQRIFQLLRHEQVRTTTLVISYLTPEKASQVLAFFRPDLRKQIIERLATLAPTSIEVVETVAEMLNGAFLNNRSRALTQTGGVRLAAQVLNALPKNDTDSLLVALRESNSDLADAILQKMLTFEELERLDKTVLQRILREVDTRSLAVALKPANEKLRTSLLSAISKRAAETVRDEITFLGPLKLSEIEAARASIVGIVRRLESEGEIDLDAIRQTSR